MPLFPLNQRIPIAELAAEACNNILNCSSSEAAAFIRQKVNQGARNSLLLSDKTSSEIDFYEPPEASSIMSMIEARADDFIDFNEADDFIKKSGYGHFLPEASVDYNVFTAIQRKFYGGSAFDGVHAIFEPLSIKLDRCADGDTCVAMNVYLNGQWAPVKVKFRLDGIDTPESYRGINAKLETFKNYIWLLWKNEYGFGENSSAILQLKDEILQANGNENKLKTIWGKIATAQNNMDKLLTRMIEDKIVYEGLIAGAATKGLAEWAAKNNIPFRLEPSFNMASSDPAICNTVEFTDTYDRFLGVLKIGASPTNEDMLAGFIENNLSDVMKNKGAEYYAFFAENKAPLENEDWAKTPPTAFTNGGKSLLNDLRTTEWGQKIRQSISPQTLPKPWELFSKEKCVELAKEWRGLVEKNPEYKNDVQAMLIFLGLGYPYPKYLNQHGEEYMKIGESAMKNGNGSYGDVVFDLMQPNPNFSKLFAEYGTALTRGRDPLPENCCKKLLREGLDKYKHCEK
ncbi:MAG: hypothetical protein HYY43_06450 [Deltaproteobacteria bacterium]|nr:hypothetical protein [Deltaproteobacteria bacterium]MBI2342083.1 hypothetical protein [Deltaproteobacteria bacterium]MBI2975211.1 hypothetical protein [Deltaproteobacteria bacterium]